MATLQEEISGYRTGIQVIGHQGLLSQLKVGNQLYDIKDPAVEQLAAAVETRLATVEGKDVVINSTGSGAYVKSVVHGATGHNIDVTLGNILDEAYVQGAAGSGFPIVQVQQAVDGTISAVTGTIAAKNVTFEATGGVAATNVQDAIIEVYDDAMALKGTSSDQSSAETIAGAKAYAKDLVDALATGVVADNLEKIKGIIDELTDGTGELNGTGFLSMIDKLTGMGWAATGTDPGNSSPSVVEYVQHEITKVNQQNTEGINALDAVVFGADGLAGATGDAADTAYAGATSTKVAVKVTEVDGKITAVDVKTNDIASATGLALLDAEAIKQINGKTGNIVEVTGMDINGGTGHHASIKIGTALEDLYFNKANAAAFTKKTVNVWGGGTGIYTTYSAETNTVELLVTQQEVWIPTSEVLVPQS